MMIKNGLVQVSSKWKALAGALAMAGALGACAAEEESGLAPIEDVGPQGLSPGAKHEILADIDVGYGRVLFHRMDTPDGHTRIAVSEMAPNTYVETPFTKLASAEATHLELFRALQPGVAAPFPLEALHPLEARGLGRASDEVLSLKFDRDAPIQKSVAACEAFVYADPPDNCGVRTWSNHRIANNVSGSNGLHVGQTWSYATTRPVTLGICNESPAFSISGRLGVDYGGNSSSSYTYWGWASLSVGMMWRWYDFRQVHECGSCSGSICTVIQGCYEPSRYRVDGTSFLGLGVYHLRTAEAYEPNCHDL